MAQLRPTATLHKASATGLCILQLTASIPPTKALFSLTGKTVLSLLNPLEIILFTLNSKAPCRHIKNDGIVLLHQELTSTVEARAGLSRELNFYWK